MAVSLERVVKQLEDSGIVAAGKIKECLPPKAHPKDAEELIRELVKQNHLTKFQAQQVSLGKSKALVLGNYTILDKIGAGGMGQVFKAEHRRLERIVAIKMLPPAMTKDASALARFQREVTAAAKLRHPNIVATDDADESNGVHFLVMEYIEGKDLSASVKTSGPFPVAKAVDHILQAARGLAFAHQKGVVHRDVKPANLLLDNDGTVKILDMGLARIESSGGPAQAELTGTGTIMGTVDYMAPEQGLSTKNADARADIYSLGCSLYYLLAGKAAYDGETVAAKLLAHHTHSIPSLRALVDIPNQVEAVFMKMVAKQVTDRYQTMSEVVAELEKCQAALHVTATSSTSVWQSSAATNEQSDLSIAFQNALLPSIPSGLADPPPDWPKKPKAGKRGPPRKNARLLAAAGAAAFLFLLLGVIVVIRNQKGEEVSRTELAPGLTAEVQTTATNPASVPKAADNLDPDRRAAEWLISKGCWLKVNDSTAALIEKLADLPQGKFTVSTVSALGKDISDLEFAEYLAELNRAREFRLDGTSVSDASVPLLVKIKTLSRLEVTNTQISDKGGAALRAGLPGCLVFWLSDQPFALGAIAAGGSVRIEGHDGDIRDKKQLPSGGFHVSAIDMSGKTTWHDAIFSNFSRNYRTWPALTSLKLEGQGITDSTLAYIRNKALTLKELSVKGTKVTAAGVAALHKALPSCKIEWDGGVIQPQPASTVDADRKAAEWAIGKGGVVRLDDTPVTAPGITKVAALPKTNFKLTTIVFSHGSVSDQECIEYLRGLRSLRYIRFNDTSITDASVPLFVNLQPRRLDLMQSKLTDVGIAALRAGLPECELFPFVDCYLATQVIKTYGGAIYINGQNKCIRDLELIPAGVFRLTGVDVNGSRTLSDNNFTGNSSNWPNTTSWVMDRTNITDVTLRSLATRAKNLKELSIKGTKVTPAGVAALQKALPSCKIEWDGPAAPKKAQAGAASSK